MGRLLWNEVLGSRFARPRMTTVGVFPLDDDGKMTVDDRQALRNELSALLAQQVAAAELGDAIARHVPELDAFRENDDLILVESGTRRLLVRRVGDRFRLAETASASGSTNLLDEGGTERDLDGLVDEIMAFAGL